MPRPVPLPALKTIKWVTTDCYGTLIDWEKGIVEACKKEAEKDGFSFEEGPFLARFMEVQAEIMAGSYELYAEAVSYTHLRAALDPDPVDPEGALAARAADVHAEDRAGVLLGLSSVGSDLDPAGLAATADQHLGLDRAGVADPLGGGDSVLNRRGDLAARHGYAVRGEKLLALILKKIHVKGARLPSAAGSL